MSLDLGEEVGPSFNWVSRQEQSRTLRSAQLLAWHHAEDEKFLFTVLEGHPMIHDELVIAVSPQTIVLVRWENLASMRCRNVEVGGVLTKNAVKTKKLDSVMSACTHEKVNTIQLNVLSKNPYHHCSGSKLDVLSQSRGRKHGDPSATPPPPNTEICCM